MGLFDKVKAFAGGKGMAKVTIEALQDCGLLATEYDVWLYISDDPADQAGSPSLVATAMDPDPNTSYVETPFEYPLDMTPGRKRVRLVVKCIADVKQLVA